MPRAEKELSSAPKRTASTRQLEFPPRSLRRKQLEASCSRRARKELARHAPPETPPDARWIRKTPELDRQEWGRFSRAAKRAAARQWWPKAVKCCEELARRTDPQERPTRGGPEPTKRNGKVRRSPIEKIPAKERPGLV